MQLNIDLAKILETNERISYYDRMKKLLADCETLRESEKDYWTCEHYATLLEQTASKLRRRAEKVKEDIKNDEK